MNAIAKFWNLYSSAQSQCLCFLQISKLVFALWFSYVPCSKTSCNLVFFISLCHLGLDVDIYGSLILCMSRKMLGDSEWKTESTWYFFGKHICASQKESILSYLQSGDIQVHAWFNWVRYSWRRVGSWTCNNSLQPMLVYFKKLSLQGYQVV